MKIDNVGSSCNSLKICSYICVAVVINWVVLAFSAGLAHAQKPPKLYYGSEPIVFLDFTKFDGGTSPALAKAQGWVESTVVDVVDICTTPSNLYKSLERRFKEGRRCTNGGGYSYAVVADLGNKNVAVIHEPGWVPNGSKLWLRFNPDGSIDIMDAKAPKEKK